MQPTMRAKRVKRASAEQLYKTCQQGGDCIPDVVAKYEHKTPADKILQIGGSVIYLGGLSIGTGKGTGGSTGYRPLGVDVNASTTRPVLPRPAIPTETIGVDVGSGTVSAGESSIIPLLEAGAGGDAVTISPEVPTITEDLVINPSSGAPTVTTAAGEGESVAVLEVGTTPSTNSRVTSTSQHTNPSFTPVFHSTPQPGEASTLESIVVGHSTGGRVVDVYEEIPLDDFGPSEFEIEDPTPRTSTPRSAVTNLVQRARQFYNRRFAQVQVTNEAFLSRPASLVEFENPAYQPEETVVFPAGSGEPLAAPDPDFADVRVLNRAVFQANPRGGVRVSRLGTKNTIRLRSGTHIGGSTHYFYDLSSISLQPEIELSVLGEHSGESEIVLGSTTSTVIDAVNVEGTISVPEEDVLLDEYVEDFSHSQLALSGGSRSQSRVVDIPEFQREVPKGSVIIDDLSDSIHVAHPGGRDTTAEPFSPPHSSDVPSSSSDSVSSTFDLHPSLLKRRKRKRGDI
ncbi:L2 [Canis familiaris papillomavirus 17]|uniref:Minor capsid protein L2 n=5 Tax=Canis familiaris papillomavirus 17 TaxID=1778550 RepID=A0A0U4IRM5_9PAPI|nr:L2 [Canis familiaris papillomavirus 17]